MLVAAACSADGRKVLTVYSPHGKDLLEYYEQEFEKAHPDDRRAVGGHGVAGSARPACAPRRRIRRPMCGSARRRKRSSERRRKVCSSRTRRRGQQRSIRRASEAGDNWYGTYLTPEVIAYNTEAVKEADAPKDWDDVLDPKWKGKILIRDPIASGTMRAIFGAIIARSMRADRQPDAGYEWLRKLDANTQEYVLNPDDSLSEARPAGRRHHAVGHARHRDARSSGPGYR